MTPSYVFHARLRMERYSISEKMIEEVLKSPDSILDGHSGRKIYQRKMASHVLRVIVEEETGIKRVVTVYWSGSDRYEV
jgi:hypothetical protein